MGDETRPEYQKDFAKKPLTPASQTQGETLKVKQFKLTDIPDVMDKLQWTQGARFMRKWFNDDSYEMPSDYKLNRKDARQLDKKHVLDDLPFDWLLTASKRVEPFVNELTQELSYINEFNSRVGRLKNILDQLSPGLVVLMSRLEALGLLDAKSKKLKTASRFFDDLPASELEYKTQFNFIKVGTSVWEKAFDKMDDVYGALGAFSIKMAATQISTFSSHAGAPAIMLSEIGLYVRDTYEFLNEGEDQLLGYWSEKGVLKPGVINYLRMPDYIDDDGTRYFKVTNGSFNKYRAFYKKGGDFLAYSTVKRIPVSISVHLNDVDFEEYLAKKDSKS